MGTVKWLAFSFAVYEPQHTNWNAVGGIYIFCGINEQNLWFPVYVGQTTSFQTRLPSHDKWEEAVFLGATHIHAMVVPQNSDRLQIEQDLVQAYCPALNQQLKPAFR